MGHLCSDNSQLDGRQTGLPPAHLACQVIFTCSKVSKSRPVARISQGGGLIWGKSGPLYYTLYGAFGTRGPPPDPPGYGPVDCCVFSYMYIYYFCIEKWTSAGWGGGGSSDHSFPPSESEIVRSKSQDSKILNMFKTPRYCTIFYDHVESCLVLSQTFSHVMRPAHFRDGKHDT